jgi:hypothetical protein
MSLIRTIVHADPSLTITEEQKGGSGDHVSNRAVHHGWQEENLSGERRHCRRHDRLGRRVPCDPLQADTAGVAIVFTEKMMLSNENKTLTDAVHIETPQGDWMPLILSTSVRKS